MRARLEVSISTKIFFFEVVTCKIYSACGNIPEYSKIYSENSYTYLSLISPSWVKSVCSSIHICHINSCKLPYIFIQVLIQVLHIIFIHFHIPQGCRSGGGAGQLNLHSKE
jgi:hypothetical protein